MELSKKTITVEEILNKEDVQTLITLGQMVHMTHELDKATSKGNILKTMKTCDPLIVELATVFPYEVANFVIKQMSPKDLEDASGKFCLKWKQELDYQARTYKFRLLREDRNFRGRMDNYMYFITNWLTDTASTYLDSIKQFKPSK